jgi:hypothetical protein
MYNFIKYLFIFLSPLVAISSLFYITFTIEYRNYFNEFLDKRSCDTLFIGDSHVQLAINDQLINNSLNMALNSESYYFTYYKLKYILQQKSNIKNIYLGLSYHNISDYYDDFIYGSHSSAISVRYFFILPGLEQLRVILWNKNDIGSFISNLTSICFSEYNSKKQFTGTFSNQNHTSSVDLNILNSRVNMQFGADSRPKGLSHYNILYLHKIKRLCETHNINLFFINTPLHSHYIKSIPKFFTNHYDQIIFNNSSLFLDFENILSNDSDFLPDGDHTSEEGANKFSKLLNGIIKFYE